MISIMNITVSQALSTTDATEAWSELDMTWPFVGLIALNVTVLLPISIILLRRYYRHSIIENDPFFTARKPKLVLLQSTIALIFMSLYLPIHIVAFELTWDNNEEIEECMFCLSVFSEKRW